MFILFASYSLIFILSLLCYLASNSTLTASCTPSDLNLINGLNSNAEYPASGTKCNLELLHGLEPSQPLTVDSISSAYASDEVFLKPQTNKSKQYLFLYSCIYIC